VELDPIALGQNRDDVEDNRVEARIRCEEKLPLVDAPSGEHRGVRKDGSGLRHASLQARSVAIVKIRE
jgi:hypothetical protein